MKKISMDKQRVIIDDFVKEINDAKIESSPPRFGVIDFRRERIDGKERPIFDVPITLLRYRKYNGRIASDVLSYEKSKGLLQEESEEAQKIIAEFLEKKDPEKTKELEQDIKHLGQKEPAIITCDGFLINGNRRKLVLDKLQTGDDRFSVMKVIKLPGKGEPGGPPSIKEIEQIENKYQLSKEGKAEYSNFDKALTIRRKEQIGMSLEDQLRDDSQFKGLIEKEFKKAVAQYHDDFIKPLECVDIYLKSLNREGLYDTISSGEREGRWQAFHDYYKYVYKKLDNAKQRMFLGIKENDIGRIEDIAFKMIRLRKFPENKVHMLMRKLLKYMTNERAKEELFEINKIDLNLSKEEKFDKSDNEYDINTIDDKWAAKNRTTIIRQVKRAINVQEHIEEMETPLDLLKSALDKLNHRKMEPEAVDYLDLHKGMKLAKAIRDKSAAIEGDFYDLIKSKSKLNQSKNRKK